MENTEYLMVALLQKPLESDRFLHLVQQTVAGWGIGGRDSVLVEPEAFASGCGREHRRS